MSLKTKELEKHADDIRAMSPADQHKLLRLAEMDTCKTLAEVLRLCELRAEREQFDASTVLVIVIENSAGDEATQYLKVHESEAGIVPEGYTLPVSIVDDLTDASFLSADTSAEFIQTTLDGVNANLVLEGSLRRAGVVALPLACDAAIARVAGEATSKIKALALVSSVVLSEAGSPSSEATPDAVLRA